MQKEHDIKVLKLQYAISLHINYDFLPNGYNAPLKLDKKK